jgi:hypothetical protein
VVYEALVPRLFETPWLQFSAEFPHGQRMVPLACDGHDASEVCDMARKVDDLGVTMWTSLREMSEDGDFDLVAARSDDVRVRRGVELIGEVFDWCCSLVTSSKLQPLIDGELTLEAQVNKINSIVHSQHQSLLDTNSAVMEYSKDTKRAFQVVEKKVRHFSDLMTNIKGRVDNQSQELAGVFQSNLGLYNSMFELLNLVRKNQILRSCRARKIPVLILPKKVLSDDLAALEIKLQEDGYKLGVPLGNIELYYKLELGECNTNWCHRRNLWLHLWGARAYKVQTG